MSTITASSYAQAVGRSLDDLPATTAAELLEGLGEHLAEVGADDFESLVDLLGPPDVYAAELRASAGLPVRGVITRSLPLPPPVSSGEETTRAASPNVMLGIRHVARIALVALAVGAVAALYASRNVVDLWVVLLITLSAGAGILAVRWLVSRSDLPSGWILGCTVALLGFALAIAATLGASHRRDAAVSYVFPQATTLSPVPAESITLPDFRHLPVEQAIETTRALGLGFVIQGIGSLIVGQDPAVGSLLDPGAVVLLTTDGPAPGSPPVATAETTTATSTP